MSDEAPRRRPLPETVISEVDVAVTLRRETVADTDAPPPGAIQPIESERYAALSLLGAGGMGEVHLCSDRVIGRDVAMKVMRAGEQGSRGTARFVREALVQARLEHPAVVPVYDVGLGPEGPAWFTMKRVRGRSLESILHALRGRDAETETRFSRRKLLDAMVRICLAIDYAHERGVVHRDLKPANVMLGDFGEVNVLDWGLAKLLEHDREDEQSLSSLSSNDDEPTMIGSLLGTPGYMSPEQAAGEVGTIGVRSDVYALGAILYEMVTLQPINRAQGTLGMLGTTIGGVDPRPPAGVEVPPELQTIWTRAIARDPADRLPSARALADELERYLDGDRDVMRRRALAAEHIASAQALLAASSDGAPLDETRHAAALRELARAVALDPSDEVALGLLGTLLVDAPRAVPPEAREELERSKDASRREAAQSAARRYLMWCAFIPLPVMMGIRDWTVTGAVIAFMVLAGLDALRLGARPRIPHRLAHSGTSRPRAALAFVRSLRERALPARIHAHEGAVVLALSSLSITLLSALFGPFVLVPGLAATNTMFFVMTSERRHRPWIVGAGLLSIIAPWVAEVAGLVPPSLRFDEHGLRFAERAAHFPETATIACLLLVSAAMVVLPAMMVSRMRDALAHAEERLFLQAWRLRQMLPRAARDAMSSEERAKSA